MHTVPAMYVHVRLFRRNDDGTMYHDATNDYERDANPGSEILAFPCGGAVPDDAPGRLYLLSRCLEHAMTDVPGTCHAVAFLTIPSPESGLDHAISVASVSYGRQLEIGKNPILA
jgi:hypothetical protein